MKTKILLNRSGESPDVTRRQCRNSLDSILSRFSVVSLICVLMLTLGVGNAWGSNWTGTSATNAPAGTYKAMTSGEAVVAGDTVIIVRENDNLAMSTTQNTNNRGTVSITVSNSTVTLNGSTAVQALTVGTSQVSGAWILTTVNGYLYAPSYASSTSNYLRTETTNKDKAGGDWVIGYNSIVANGNGTRRYIRRNGTLISCYASEAQDEIKVYKKAHTITYLANGGSTTCSDATYYKSNANVTLCASTPTRANYTFTGWTANVDLKNASTSATITAGTLISAGTTIVMPAKFVILTAQWETAGPSYTVNWTINPAAGGTLSTTSGTSTTVTPNSAYTYGSPAYTFTAGSGSVSQSTNTFTATPAENCTICINMVEKPKYTITYHVGSGTCATSSWTQTSYGEETTLPTATPSCDGWSFAGWCASSAGDEDDSTTSPGTILTGSYTPTSNVDLYAVYTKTEAGGSSTVTFNFGYSLDWGQSGSWSGTSKDEVSATKGGVTVTYTRNGSNLYANSTSIRFYQKNTLTFSASESITAIAFTVSTYQTDISSDVGTCTATSSELSWEGSANSVTFTRPNDASSYAQMSAATITIGSSTTYYMTDYECAACTAPDHVTISGRWDRFGGETISLTATAYSSAGTGSPIADANITGWQWQKYYNSQWNDISNGGNIAGATSNNLVISNCTGENSGSYQCVVSTGATCSTASNDIEVKVYTLECYTGGTTVYNFTRTGDSQAGTLTINLSASTAYTFKVHADNVYYGNNASINEDVSNYVFCNSSNGGNCASNFTINSGLGGTFTIGIDYSTSGNSNVEGEPEISVTYPRKTMYLTPGVWNVDGAKFAFYYFRDGGSSGWTGFITANDCGSSAEVPQWNGVKIDAVRLKNTCTSPNWDDKWKQTSDITVTSANSVTITGWGPDNGDSPHTYGTYTVPTYTISYAAGSTTHTSGNAISGSKANESKTCGVNFTLPSSAVFTTTGYTQDGWATSDGGSKDYNLGGSYTTNAAQAFYPHWAVNEHTLTWVTDGDALTGTYTSGTVAYGTTIVPPDTPTKLGCIFAGWHDGTSVVTPSTMPDNHVTYTATWTVKTYTVSWIVNGETEATQSNVNYGTLYSALTEEPILGNDALSDCGSDKFIGWVTQEYTAEGGTAVSQYDPYKVTSSSIIDDTHHTFYAMFATEEGTAFTLDGTVGSTQECVIYYDDGSTKYYATGAIGKDNNGKISTTTNVDEANIYVFTKTGTGTYTIQREGNAAYYYYSGSTDLGTQNASYDWTISDVSSAGLGSWRLQSGTNERAWICRTDGTPKFGGYSTTNVTVDQVYRDVELGSSNLTNYRTGCCEEKITLAVSDATSGAGGTVTMKWNNADKSVGNQVSTCSAGTLVTNVTANPSYILTAIAISGTNKSISTVPADLTTGLPSTEKMTYSVSVQALATGTLTITPTFARIYTVTYNLDGGETTGSTATISYQAGATVTFVTPNPTKAGYNFTGWVVTKEGGGTQSATSTNFTMPSDNVTVTAQWEAKSLNSISLSPSSAEIYVGQYAEFTVTYNPSDVLTKGYTFDGSPSYVTKLNTSTNTLLILEGGRNGGPSATQTEMVSIKANADNTKTASVEVTVIPLPKVHFMDIIHGYDFSDVVGTIEDNELVSNKTTPTHAEFSGSGGANTCENEHTRLVGWIEKTWADAHPDATHEDIIGAGTGIFIEANAAINVLTYNGNTYYAVWAKLQ